MIYGKIVAYGRASSPPDQPHIVLASECGVRGRYLQGMGVSRNRSRARRYPMLAGSHPLCCFFEKLRRYCAREPNGIMPYIVPSIGFKSTVERTSFGTPAPPHIVGKLITIGLCEKV